MCTKTIKICFTLLCMMITALTCPLQAATKTDTFTDYQNYNRGYCPECNCYPCRCKAAAEEVQGKAPCATKCPDGAPPPAPAAPPPAAPPCAPPPCAPCKKTDPCQPAPICATNCGINLCWVGIGIAVIATAAAIIVSSNNGGPPSH